MQLKDVTDGCMTLSFINLCRILRNFNRIYLQQSSTWWCETSLPGRKWCCLCAGFPDFSRGSSLLRYPVLKSGENFLNQAMQICFCRFFNTAFLRAAKWIQLAFAFKKNWTEFSWKSQNPDTQRWKFLLKNVNRALKRGAL